MTVKDHAAEAVTICYGCGCSLCYGQKFRSLYLQTIDMLIICHDKKDCLVQAMKRVEHTSARLEVTALVRWLLTEEQRNKRHLS